MTRSTRSNAAPHIVIAGGGFAGVEAMLSLRALMGDAARLTLIGGDADLAYRPAATVEPFADDPPAVYDLRAIASDAGATFHSARLESVGSGARYVRLSSGSRRHYDALVLAIGARTVSSISGALTFSDQRDVQRFRRVLGKVRAGRLRRLLFALPNGHAWAVPLYELALLTAREATEHGRELDVTIVSPERAPLEVFGEQPSATVAAALRERGVGFVGDVAAQSVQRDGSLLLRSGRSLAADAVIAGPQLRGRWITGVPADKWGFVPVETDGRVIGMPHVYAAGDVSDYPVKQAGLATQQADVVADRIARSFGVTGPPREIQRVLRARLVGGDQPLYLRAELDAEGQATGRAQARAASPEEAALPKVFARHLTPYLADREPDLLRANG